jgi:hypothetical protein
MCYSEELCVCQMLRKNSWKCSSDDYVIRINISVGIQVLKPHNKFITPEGVREGSRGKTPGEQFRRQQTEKLFHFPLYLTHSIGVSSPHHGQFVNSSATWHNTQTKVQETIERERDADGRGLDLCFLSPFIPFWATASRVASTVDNMEWGGVWSKRGVIQTAITDAKSLTGVVNIWRNACSRSFWY